MSDPTDTVPVALFEQLEAENAKLKEQNDRLKSRGIQDMQFEIAQWREAFTNMKHVDCRREGGVHSIDHADWLALLEAKT